MKRLNKTRKRYGWIIAWIVQIAQMAACCLVTALAWGAPSAVYGLLIWLATPLCGALTACRAVQRGLLNYAAWIAPPACLYLAHYLLWGFAPSAGAALLCAFVSLVGAATGEVLNQRHGGQ